MSAQADLESELICEKLLGWRRDERGYWTGLGLGVAVCDTPTFEDWGFAGFILDAIEKRGVFYSLESTPDHVCEFLMNPADGWSRTRGYGQSGPLSIRSAALIYLESLA